MPDVNYAAFAIPGTLATNKESMAIGTRATTSVQVFNWNNSAVLVDDDYIAVSVFR